jgi:hypothetical protein
VYFLPPAILLDECKIPSRDGIKTVGDMVRVIKADEEAMLLVNANLFALREYRAGLLKMQAESKAK